MGLKSKPLKPTTHFGPKVTSIPSEELYSRLVRALPYVPPNSKNFALSLIQNHETYGGWTVKQLEHAELLVERAREAYRGQHGTRERVKERTSPTIRVSEDAMRGIKRMFDSAKAAAVKKPSLLVQVGDAFGLKLQPARTGPAYVMFDRDMKGPSGFVGGLKPTGALDIRPKYAEHSQAICDALDSLGTNPAGAAMRYGKLTGVCCMCSRMLTDKRSIRAGYGPICAAKWNLSW